MFTGNSSTFGELYNSPDLNLNGFGLTEAQVDELSEYCLGYIEQGCSSIHFYGSRARGDNKPSSDCDLYCHFPSQPKLEDKVVIRGSGGIKYDFILSGRPFDRSFVIPKHQAQSRKIY